MDLSTSYTIKAQVTGQNEIGGLTKGLGKLQKTTNSTSAAMNKLKTAAGNAFGALKALAPAIGVAAMGKFVSDTLTAGDRLEKFAQSTGVAVPLLDKLRKASELAGTDFKTLVKTFPMLANNINQASLGNAKLEAAFGDLGIAVHNSNGTLRATDEVLLDIADEFSKMKDGVDKASFAYDIFGGKTGEQLIPLLNGGRESIEGLGTAMTEHGVKRMAAFNDSITNIQHVFQDLFVVLTESLLPHFEKFVTVITFLVNKFVALPSPVQAIIASLGILVPLVVTIVPLLGAMAISIKAIAAIKLGAMFAAAVPAIAGLMPVLAPFLIGGAVLAGLIALGKLIGTVVGHIFAARDQIGSAMAAIGQALLAPFKAYAQFVGNVFRAVVDNIKSAFMAIPNAVKSAISAATAPLRSFLSFINKILSRLARLRRQRKNNSSNNNGTPPGMAAGGVVSSPQLIYAGEAGSEYVVPARKAAQFSKNYLSGMRGSAAIPRFAEGGYITRPNVNITTGAVTQMDGTNFITTNDLSSAVQSGIDQTLNLLQSDLRTRRSLGMA
jgi:hypothetical protein